MPLSSGMEMSMTTTSGCNSCARAIAARPSSASPTTSMSGCALTSDFSPSRSITWSSANTILSVFTGEDLLLGRGRGGYARARSGAAARRRVYAERASDERHAFAHAQQPEAAARLAAGLTGDEPAAVVLDDDE